MDVESLDTLNAVVDRAKTAITGEVLPQAQTLIDASVTKAIGQLDTTVDKIFNRAEALVDSTVNKLQALLGSLSLTVKK